MNTEDSKVARAVEHSLDDIAIVIDLIAKKVIEHGRVVYFGAGTSGRYLFRSYVSKSSTDHTARLGVLDASEM